MQRAKALDARATRLAIDIAAKLLARLPDSARVAGFVDGVAASLARLPADVRASLADEDAQVRLVAPRALTAQEAAACRAAFAASVGRPLERRARARIEIRERAQQPAPGSRDHRGSVAERR
ncbi:ATP synthase F0 subunit B [Burkholderia pseudomallei]|nr:ATP synthase F0 subunit B [Burkholderia pseudomallei]